MKRIIIFQILILCLNTNAQIDSVKDALKYYPLHIGDYWQYSISKKASGMQDSIWTGYKEVLGDTIMPNGKTYFTIKTDGWLPVQGYINHIRVDTTTANVYMYDWDNQEVLIDSLLAKKGDIVCDGFICTEDTVKEYFGVLVNTKIIESYYITTTGNSGYELAQDFGEIMSYFNDITVYYIHYEYKLNYAKIDGKEYGVQVSIPTLGEMQKAFSLSQNYPNPFNPVTRIEYQIPSTTKVQLKVYDLLGREVATLVDEEKPAGSYEVEFDAARFPSGVYFYTLQTGSFCQTKKLVLVK
ncbi:MAG: T9SS type A sorting domain-containing protein [bacterium]